MSRKFKLRNNDVLKLKKIKKSASNKKSRLKNKFNIIKEIDYKKPSDFKSRKEFNNYINDLENFTNRNNERYVKNKNDVVISRDLYQQIQKEINSLNKKNEKTIKNISDKTFKSRNNDTNEDINSRIKMGDNRYNSLIPKNFNFDSFTNVKDLNNYLFSLKNGNTQDYRFKKNYLSGINAVFGKIGDKLYKKIENMTNENFIKLYYTEDIISIDFFYDFIDTMTKLKMLEDIFGV